MSEANTNTDAELSEEPTQQQQSRASPTDSTAPADPTAGFDIRTNLYRAALGLFALLAVVAVVQLYASANAAIDAFISREYRPLFRAAFNLVVLLIAGIGISWTVRELNEE